MRISEIKNHLSKLDKIAFQLPDGSLVPNHFHVTEVGQVTKNFIDCGGTIRHEEVANFQLWEAYDYDHRINPKKLVSIIELSENILGLKDSEIEVEYQGETIGKYNLDFDGTHFLLSNKQTACLAMDKCGVPQEKPRVKLNDLQNESACTPGGGCC